MTIFYFTGTGNSLAVAKAIGGKLVSIPQIIGNEEQTWSDDSIGVVFPVYNLDLPKMVRKFLDRVVLKAEYTFVIATCGNRAGKSLPEAQRLAEKNGYRFDYFTAIPMVDNCLPQGDMIKEKEKGEKKNIGENLARIAADIGGRVMAGKPPASGGSLVARFSRTGGPVADDYAQDYIVDEKCTGCGICTQVCPTGNITVTGKAGFGNYCEGCQACIHICPNQAIHLKRERSTARWRHPGVTMREIMDANNVRYSQ